MKIEEFIKKKPIETITFKTSGGYGPTLNMSFEIDPEDTDMNHMIYMIRQWLLAYGFAEDTINRYICEDDATWSHWDTM